MNIRRGDTGPDVERVQRELRRAGIDVDADGIFGRATQRAVERFQRDHNLAVDGVVGIDTLAALGLDDEDEDSAIGGDPTSSDAGDATDFAFDANAEAVPPEVRRRIASLVDTIEAAVELVLRRAEQAIDQFETTMQFGSTSSEAAVPERLLVEVVLAVGRHLARRLTASLPGFDEAVDLAGGLMAAAIGTPAASGHAATRASAGRWIKDQRTMLGGARGALRLPPHQGELTPLEALTLDIESGYLASDDKQATYVGIVNAKDNLAADVLPTLNDLEARLYEQWINEHFREIGPDRPGCIEFRNEFDGDTFDFVSCTVDAPFGPQIEDGLNRLFSLGLVAHASRPFELRVRKRACFRVDNVNPGGKTWSCGWLDEDGNVIHNPPHNAADRALHEQVWQLQGRFVR